jgi:hypothetical protein
MRKGRILERRVGEIVNGLQPKVTVGLKAARTLLIAPSVKQVL